MVFIGFMSIVISRFRGFHRFCRFHNHRFHQERIVSWKLFVVPWVLWFHEFRGFTCFVVSWIWLHRFPGRFHTHTCRFRQEPGWWAPGFVELWFHGARGCIGFVSEKTRNRPGTRCRTFEHLWRMWHSLGRQIKCLLKTTVLKRGTVKTWAKIRIFTVICNLFRNYCILILIIMMMRGG